MDEFKLKIEPGQFNEIRGVLTADHKAKTLGLKLSKVIKKV